MDTASKFGGVPFDVKGKGRAFNDDDAELFAHQAVRTDEGSPLSNLSSGIDIVHEDTRAVAQPSETASTSATPFPQLHLDDRFDWRQTAFQFRQFHLSNISKTRRSPSAHILKTSNQRSEKLNARVAAYQERLSYLVGLERDDEVAAWERLRSRSLEDLIAEGWVMDGLVAYWQGGDTRPQTAKAKGKQQNLASKPRIAILTRSGLRKLPWTRFKEGDQVELNPSAETGNKVEDFLPREDAVLSSVSSSANGKSKATESRLDTNHRVTATVISSDAYRLRLLLAPPSSRVDLEACASWRLDLAFNDAIYHKIGAVIDALAVDCAGLERKDAENRFELMGTDLAQYLLPGSAALEKPQSSTDLCESIFANDLRIKSWYERYLQPDPLVMEGDPHLGLNESQTKAVALMLANRLSLIQGPPGTGKTHTLVSAIKLLKHHFAVSHPVLLSAHTNVAVDNLVEGALDAGLNVVRVSPTNVVSKSERVESCNLEKQMERHPMFKKLEEIKIRVGNAKRRMATLFESDSGRKVDAMGHAEPSASGHPPVLSDEVKAELKMLRRTIGRLAQQSYMLTRQIQSHVLYNADVVCSTLISSTSSALGCIDFPLVFIDESTQALEHLSLMPLVKGARQVALIGDHKQLPPVLKSREARQEGGAISLFERLISEDGLAHGQLASDASVSTRTKMQMLQVQHRMHPDLAAFPNAQFYGGQLQSAARTGMIPAVKHSLVEQSDTSPASARLIFIDHEGQEFVNRSSSEVSLLNSREVSLLFHVLYDLLESDKTLTGSSIGIITPYLAQSRLIARLLRPIQDRDCNHPTRLAIEKALGPAKLAELEKVEVNTVDGFQGREKDVVIFSSVRCSTTRRSETSTAPMYNVGFLADERRLNVALTRAKKALFVLGHLDTWRNGRGLTHGEVITVDEGRPAPQDAVALRNFAAHVEEHGLVVDEETLLSKVDIGLDMKVKAKKTAHEQGSLAREEEMHTGIPPSTDAGASLGFGKAFT